jgi:hypothetical protein
MGDYSLCENWKIIIKTLNDLIMSNILELAAIDSCKPGIVIHGLEKNLRWCDMHPSYLLYYHREPWRRNILYKAVLEDIRSLLPYYKYIVYYVNVKAYREALDSVRKKLATNKLVNAGPPNLSPLSYRSRKNRMKLRKIILELYE